MLPLSSSSNGRRKKQRGRRGAAETPTPPALTEGWEAAHPWAVELRAIVGDAAWRAWFSDCSAGVTGELLVPSTFAAEHIQNGFAAQLRTIGDHFKCSVVVNLVGQRVAA
ncbi:MAG: hypothetical protein HOP13_02315 [Alphaproteobacteria bacterium]|nr:hypothetical protein [Alphaproteobacteria bacterium]